MAETGLTRVAIAGVFGKMGKTLVEAALKDGQVTLAAAFDRADSGALGRDVGEFCGAPCGVLAGDSVSEALAVADCLIDFTRPEGTMTHLAAALQARKAMVIGTTGFSAEQKKAIEKAAATIPVVCAPNMAIGVNAVFKLLAQASRILDDGYDVEVVEMHHRHKVDAPSGTALRMAEIVAEQTGRNLDDCAVYGRHGHTGARRTETIGISSLRGGDVIGDHTVIFAGSGERIEVTHKSGGRMSYAMGALKAAVFLRGKTDGLFDMQDVLGLR